MANRISFDKIESLCGENFLLKRSAQEVFKNLGNSYFEHKTVTDEDLISLSLLFGDILEKALELIKGRKITYFYTKADNNGIYQVEGSCCKTYTIYPSINYCSCPSYKFQVCAGSQTICKHVLAAAVSHAIGRRELIEETQMNSKKEECFENYFSWKETSEMGPPSMFNISTNNWAHIPPQTMPWGLQSVSQPPSVVRFTAGNFSGPTPSVKRKSDSPTDLVPAKVLITEEKMAAHMKSLHISDDKANSQGLEINLKCKDEMMETDRLPKLVISNEINNFKTEPLIPESILKRLEKPDMALVLWQPPPIIISDRIKKLGKPSKIKGKSNDCPENMEVENKEDGSMDVTEELENSSKDAFFRPDNPAPVPSMPDLYFQMPSQF